jgi:hypothetical protein
MPWNPEHYNRKKKLFPLKDHYIPGLTEMMKPIEKYGDFRDDIVEETTKICDGCLREYSKKLMKKTSSKPTWLCLQCINKK